VQNTEGLADEIIIGLALAANDQQLRGRLEPRATGDAENCAALVGGEFSNALSYVVGDGVGRTLKLASSMGVAFGQLGNDLFHKGDELERGLIHIEVFEFEVHESPKELFEGLSERLQEKLRVGAPDCSEATLLQPQIAPNESHLDHAQVIDGGLLKAREDSAAFLEPSDQALDDVAVAIGLFVEVHETSIGMLVCLRWNYGGDSQIEQVLIDPLGSVTLVACQGARPLK
jgi:hypothetical protein